MAKMKELSEKVRQVSFTPENLKQFKKAYAVADKAGKETFEFAGGEWVLGFARYAIIYLDDRFGINKIR